MIRENQRLLNLFHIIIDALIIAAAFLLSYELRFNELWSPLIRHHIISPPIGYYLRLDQYLNTLVFLIPCFIIIYRFCGLYDPKRTNSKRHELYCLIKANLFGIVYGTAILYFIKQTDYARLFLTMFIMINLTADYIFRLIVMSILKLLRKRGKNLKHILLVGYSRMAEGYIDRLRAHPEWGYYVHGILDDNKPVGESYRNVDVIGNTRQLADLLATNKYDEIAITLRIQEFFKLEKIVATCEKSGIHTKFIPDYNNIIPTRPYTEDLDGLPVIHVRNVPLTNSFNKFIKRTVDIIGSICLIILFSIPMLVVAILVKATSEGPLIFKQERIGLGGKPFLMYKFRSMAVQKATEEQKAWTTPNDPRVTPVGKFIRKTSLDELPQFFNVLKGDMSLVGPRPERPFFVEKFKEEIPRYMIKHQVRPGITGWAQVNGYRGDTSIRMRIDCDLYYIENWTLMLDIKILLLTVVTGFINKNAY